MKHLVLVLATLVAVTGCSKKKEDAAGGGSATGGGGDDCGSVIPAAVDRVMPEMAKEMAALPPDKMAQLGPKMKEVLLTRCNADKWPAEHLACLAVGKTNADMQKCDKTLPKDAKEKLKADLGVAMKDILGDMTGGPSSVAKPKAEAVKDEAAGSGSAAPGSGSGS